MKNQYYFLTVYYEAKESNDQKDYFDMELTNLNPVLWMLEYQQDNGYSRDNRKNFYRDPVIIAASKVKLTEEQHLAYVSYQASK